MSVSTKKLLSLLVVVAMVLTMAPAISLSVFAAIPDEAQTAINNAATKISDAADCVDLTATELAAIVQGNTCPMCGAQGITWTKRNPGVAIKSSVTGAAQAYHMYYNAEGTQNANSATCIVGFSGTGMNQTACVVLLGGANITTSNRFIINGAAKGAKINIMGSGTINYTGTDALFSVEGAASTDISEVNIYGGNFTSTGGTLFDIKGGTEVNVYGGNIGNPTALETAQRNVVIRTSAYAGMNLYGGTIRNGVTGDAAKSGNVSVEVANGEFHMYGGSVTGGKAVSGVANNGGNVSGVSGAGINIYGGEISGGIAGANGGNIYSAGTVNLYGGSVTGGKAAAYGGNVQAATLNTYADITDGQAVNGGGNIYVGSGQTLNVKGGNITGGWGSDDANFDGECDATSVVALGGNIRSDGGNVNISDGTISGGRYENKAHASANICFNGGTLDISGGSVAGDIMQNGSSAATVTLSGAPTITEGGKTGLQLTAATADITDLTADARICFTKAAADAPVAVTNAYTGTEDLSACFSTTVEGYVVAQDATDKAFYFKEAPATIPDPVKGVFDPAGCGGKAYCEACEALGITDQPVEWTAYDKATHGTIDANAGHQHLYLTADVTHYVDGTSILNAETDVCLHLNGHNVKNSTYADADNTAADKANRRPMFTTTAKLNIMGEGSVNGLYSDAAGKGAVIDIDNAGADVHLFGGTYKKNAADFPVVRIGANGGSITMYDGVLLVGRDDRVSAQAGVVNVTGGTFTMEGGTITKGYSTSDGGAVRIGTTDSSAVFNMKGGSITNGSSNNTTNPDNAYGGNVSVRNGEFNMSGGTVSGGYATTTGGNIATRQNGEVTISGTAIVSGGTADENGDNISVSGELSISGGTITGAAGGDNILIGGVADITGGTISGADTDLKIAGDVTLGADVSVANPIVVTDVATLNLNGQDVTVNVGGNPLTVNGEGVVDLFDSANDEYAVTGGKVTVVGDITVTPEVVVGDNRYIIIEETTDVYSAHRFEMKLTHVTLRPAAGGLYYKAQFKCDQTLANRIDAYGVVLSVNNTPGVDFLTETTDKNGFTVYGDFSNVYNSETHTVATTSGSLFGILKDPTKVSSNGRTKEQNVVAAAKQVYANVYLAISQNLDDDTLSFYMADTENQNTTNGISYSLVDVLDEVNKIENWNRYTPEQQANARKFVEKWLTWITDDAATQWQTALSNILAA